MRCLSFLFNHYLSPLIYSVCFGSGARSLPFRRNRREKRNLRKPSRKPGRPPAEASDTKPAEATSSPEAKPTLYFYRIKQFAVRVSSRQFIVTKKSWRGWIMVAALA